MDKIHIKDLEIYAYHGVFQQEKDMGQKFLLSLELSMDLKPAGKTDDLNMSVSYAEVCHRVEEEFKKHKFDLIEKVAEHIAEFILLEFNLIQGVKLFLKKPWAPIGMPIDYAGVEIERYWHKAYIGVGTNMGDKEKNINDSIEFINMSKVNKVIKKSELYKTKPVGYLEQDDFMNCALEIRTLLTPMELVEYLLDLEKNLKRERLVKWGPRTIDLDVLLYDDIISSKEEIVIPHPRMHERMFVLKPLADIAPYVMHPILNKRIYELKDELEKKEINWVVK